MLQFLNNFYNTVFSLLRIVKNLTLFRRIKDPDKRTDRKCYVLANGPSLPEDLNNEVPENSSDIMVVNNFACDHRYEIYKPSIYIFTDPIYWQDKSLLLPAVFTARENTLKQISVRTQWPLCIYIPYNVSKSSIIDQLRINNHHIKIIRFNSLPVHGFRKFRFFCYKHNIGTPIANNVLGAALYLAILKQYSSINILGVDHSWVNNLCVNPLNQVCFKDEHFYSSSEYEPLMKNTKETFKMSEILVAFSTMFKAYEELNEFSSLMGTRITNHTKNSHIDSFPRR